MKGLKLVIDRDRERGATEEYSVADPDADG